MVEVDPNLYGDGAAPRACRGGEEHDVELYETNKRGGYDVWMCMLCDLRINVPHDLKPKDFGEGS